ncbi:low specificity L-threonine aldolase [Flavobacterium sp. CS20]|jgi:threonine aldolase|uniref:threonine aldolase family protein n=1 Tax=Flavobacterium sp. CS20 TaxID=2775246 RepID=UPI001B39F632|nr:GntG family PLP-dependent aldolase [Flavobacterium sp. CS20]QTY26153.1 threonine aldolase [Flavobacterium sp. CS20]
MIDLRSDTVTQPTKEMLDFMLSCAVGDDVYKEDPTVNALEKYVSDLFGMDSALYFPTGSMANQAAIKLHTQPGEQLICDKWAHVYNYEGGGASFNSGVSCKLIDGDKGMITATQVKNAINPPDFYHSPLTSLVCLENTTNKGGGACYDFETMKAIKTVCDDQDLGLHLDGARVFNAFTAQDYTPRDLGQIFDSISICLSKGLGAPMGTVLVGKQKLMQKAMRVRKVLGGGMRQIGYMAGCGLFALKNNVNRLQVDHDKAKEISNTLEKLDHIKKVEPTETNIVIFYLNDEIKPSHFEKYLAEKNVKISNMGEGKWRIVTHLDYSDEMHEAFLEILNKFEN